MKSGNMKFGRLSLAILENFVEGTLGKKFVDELRSPTDRTLSLQTALAYTEDRFKKEFDDKDLARAIFIDLPVDKPALGKAVGKFFDHPTDHDFPQSLENILTSQFKNLSKKRVKAAVVFYIKTLKQEIALADEGFRENIKLLADLEILNYIEKIEEHLRETEKKPSVIDTPPPKLALSRIGNLPPRPSLIIGRDDDFQYIKTRLGVNSASVEALTAVHGWPGVGKTTFAAALAHDPEISVAFPDGILWASLGTAPDIFHELSVWGRYLGIDNLTQFNSIQEISTRLAALLHGKRILLILDDVWESKHATPFNVGGLRCAMLITTREKRVAQDLTSTANDIHKLEVLTEEKGLELLQKLMPTVILQYPQSSLELVRELEGLPLALQVAGRMLNIEITRGFGIDDLLTDIKTGAKLLEEQSPANRIGVAGETSFSVAALLQKSTDRLDAYSRDCFAYLGLFAPKPATFDMAAMKHVWEVEDPRPTVGILVDRGLLEFIPETERYWMHALLVMHADSLLTD